MALKIGIQLYTLRDAVNGDFPGLLNKVAEVGYQGVEFAGYHGINADEMKKLLVSNNLTAVGAHIGLESFQNDFDNTVGYLKTIGAKFASIPGLSGHLLADTKTTINTAEKMNEVAIKTKKQGISLSFHNHFMEFARGFDGMTAHEIFQKYAPELQFELDTGWSFRAGRDNAQLIKELGKRLDLVHLKDIDNDIRPVEICTGNVDVKAVIETALSIGIEWGVVEQDVMKAYPAFESMKVSFDNIKKINK